MTDLEQQAIAYAEAVERNEKLEAIANDLRELRDTANRDTLPDDPRELAKIIKACEQLERTANGVKMVATFGLGHALKSLGVKG